MWKDEMQAWLLTRDSHSLFELFHHLRYEGHPALWYLLLYLPAHISWNPVSMQVLNYLISVCEAWLIVSARKLHWSIRLLTIFSYFIFFQHGAVARSYMLATVLLTAAVRCLIAANPKRKMAILFFALAINTHVFAAAIAAPFVIWEFVVVKARRSITLRNLLGDSNLWFATLVISGALLTAWLTVRPAPDLKPSLAESDLSGIARSLMRTEAYAWNAFIPIAEGPVSARLKGRLLRDHFFAAWATLAVFLLLLASIRTSRARAYFISTSVLLMLCIAVTIHFPQIHRLGLLFLTFFLALLIDAHEANANQSRQWLSRQSRYAVILSILICQAFIGLYAGGLDWLRPYSAAKDVSVWLKEQGLENNPMIIPYEAGAVLGYLERPSAYLGNWGETGSFAVWNTRFNEFWTLSEKDLSDAQGRSRLPVIAIMVYGNVDKTSVSKLGLVELKSVTNAIISDENFTVYEWRGQ